MRMLEKASWYAAWNQESADYVKTQWRIPKISLVHSSLIRFTQGHFQNVKVSSSPHERRSTETCKGDQLLRITLLRVLLLGAFVLVIRASSLLFVLGFTIEQQGRHIKVWRLCHWVDACIGHRLPCGCFVDAMFVEAQSTTQSNSVWLLHSPWLSSSSRHHGLLFFHQLALVLVLVVVCMEMHGSLAIFHWYQGGKLRWCSCGLGVPVSCSFRPVRSCHLCWCFGGT
jgi:hypothetical protein